MKDLVYECPYRTPIAVSEFIQDYLKDKLVCELGSGVGDNMLLMQRYARKVIGVEYNKERHEIAKERGLEVLNASYREIELPLADVYYFWPDDGADDNEYLVDKILSKDDWTGTIIVAGDTGYPDELPSVRKCAERGKLLEVPFYEGEGVRQSGTFILAIIERGVKTNTLVPEGVKYYRILRDYQQQRKNNNDIQKTIVQQEVDTSSPIVKLDKSKLLQYYPLRNPAHIPLAAKQLIQNKNVCDLGCGAGDLLYLFKKEGAKSVTGYEINEDLVNLARKNGRSFVKEADLFTDNINLEEFDIFYIWPSNEDFTRKIVNIVPKNKIVISGWSTTCVNEDDIDFDDFSIVSNWELIEKIGYIFDEEDMPDRLKQDHHNFLFSGKYNLFIYRT